MTKLTLSDGISFEYDPANRRLEVRVPDGYKQKRTKVANTYLFQLPPPRKRPGPNEVID